MSVMRLDSASGIQLHTQAGPDRARMEEAARGLESQFARMMIQQMRAGSMGNSLFPGENQTYRDMYDQQLSRELSKGRGLGLAPAIMRQLERSTGSQPSESAAPAAMPLPGARPATAMPLATTGGGLALQPSSRGVSMAAIAPLPMPSPVATRSIDSAAGSADCDDAALDCSTPENFVASIWPHAERTAKQLGVPAKAIVAQAALETGWGRRLVGGNGSAATSHNLFGIKGGGSWNGKSVNAATHEYVNGVRVNQRDAFRAYGSAAESFDDYARLLSRPRYQAVRGSDNAHEFGSALQRAGYATDPAYARKIAAIADGATMRRALARLGHSEG